MYSIDGFSVPETNKIAASNENASDFWIRYLIAYSDWITDNDDDDGNGDERRWKRNHGQKLKAEIDETMNEKKREKHVIDVKSISLF